MTYLRRLASEHRSGVDRELEAAGESIAVAVGGQNDIERAHAGPADLQDLLIVAVNVWRSRWPTTAADDAALAQMPAAAAMGLSDSAIVRIMLESQTDMEMLQAALG